jgi:YVTN family beta-propeller protein
MRKMLTRGIWLGPVLLAGTAAAMAQTNWDVTKTMPIGGEGGWDYATVEPGTHHLFVTRSTHTTVIDTAMGKVVGDVPGQKRSHGTALVPSVGRGFITDGGGDGAIVVFDLKTYAVLGNLSALPDSDGIIYDKGQGLVLAVSGDKGMLMAFKADIDPVNGKIDAPIDLGGAPEFLASDGEKAYVNLEDRDIVAVVDLKTRKVIARWPVAPGGHPVGMAIDRKTHRLFIGCRNPQKLIVMSTDDGKVLASLPIGAGVDATAVDAGRAFASCGDGSLVVVEENAGKFVVKQVVKTKFGARTMGVDESTHTIYLPTAEYEPLEAGERRPKAKPDTFMIVEVGEK